MTMIIINVSDRFTFLVMVVIKAIKDRMEKLYEYFYFSIAFA